MYVLESIMSPACPILISNVGRRRKIRCTYIADHPNVCNECRLRGSRCVDQEHNEDDQSMPQGSERGEQRYSLRERVAQLENVVQDLVKRLDQQSTAINSPGKQKITNPFHNLELKYFPLEIHPRRR